MSVIPLEVAKRRLRTIGTYFDADLQQALDSAEEEACRYLNRAHLPTMPHAWPTPELPEPPPDADHPVVPDVIDAVLLLVQASFNAATPDDVAGYRRAAEVKLHPYRVCLGV